MQGDELMTILLLSIWLLLITAPASAGEEVKLEEIVVTATRMAEPVRETTSDVIVIPEEDIRKMNVNFVPEVLREIPDLHVIQSGGPGKVASVLLRGGSSSHTLVLIDGTRVNSTTTGSYDFSGINVDDIERIEIVKGPQSTVYGSEAMAGVISIITKKGKEGMKTDVSMEAGSNGSLNPAATIAGGYKTTDYRLTGTYFQTDGISAAESGTERDGYRNASLSGKLGFRPTEKFGIEFTGRYFYDRSELDGFDFFGRKAVDDLNYVQHGHHALLSGKGMLRLSDMWYQTISVTFVRDSLDFRDPDTAFNNADVMTTIRTVDWQHDFSPAEYYAVIAGFEYTEEKGDNTGNFDQSLDNYALYINNKLKLLGDALVVTAGARHDDLDISGTKTTARFGAVYTLSHAGVSIRAGYGTGFRAPSLNELFFPFYGNPNLKPEETTSWEVGIEKDFFEERVHLSATYFDQEYENLITTNPLTFTAANIADAHVKGLEMSAAIQINDNIHVKTGYAYLDTKDRQTGNQLPLRPQDKLNLTVDVSIKGFTFVAYYTFVGERYDSSVKRTLSSYSLVSMSSSFRVSKGITLFARGENLLGENYEEIGSFGTPGFSLYGGMRISF